MDVRIEVPEGGFAVTPLSGHPGLSAASLAVDGCCRVHCRDCRLPIGMLVVNEYTKRVHLTANYGHGGGSGRQRVDLPCPLCGVTRSCNTAKSLMREIRAGRVPFAH